MLYARNSAALFATVGIGLLAGILLGTGMVGLTSKGLPEASWVMQFQLEDRLFAKVMPPFMLFTLLTLITACFLVRGRSRFLLGLGVLFMVLVLVVTVGFEVPLNRQIQSWSPGATPSGWQDVRDLWLKRHHLRTIASILGFISALLALVAQDRLLPSRK